ncbi:HNH endonuclease [Satellite phage MiniFlayer]|nr:HNH endonuclease [Satellite phage MiniFlayer]
MKCAFGACERTAVTKGLCSGHYQQQRRGVELTPLRVFTKRDSNGKVCTKCSEYKKYEEFYKNTNGVHFAECRDCYSIRQRSRYAARRGQEGA